MKILKHLFILIITVGIIVFILANFALLAVCGGNLECLIAGYN